MSVFIITNAKRTGGIERSQPLIDGYNIEWTDGWTDGRMDGWDVWDGWMDGMLNANCVAD